VNGAKLTGLTAGKMENTGKILSIPIVNLKEFL